MLQDNVDRLKDHYDGHGPHTDGIEWEDVGSDPPGHYWVEVANLSKTKTLLGYWRLGESSGPFQDTSGWSTLTPAQEAGSTLPSVTRNVGGALPGSDDDGAVEINEGYYLVAPEVGTPAQRKFNFDNVADPMTVAAWVKPLATVRTLNAPICGTWQDAGFGNCGWVLLLQQSPTSQQVSFVRRESGSPADAATAGPIELALGVWVFAVGTYSGAGAVHKLYLNGALVSTVVNANITSLPTFNTGVYIGGGGGTIFTGGGAYALSAVIDEVSVWKAELSLDEIGSLAEAGGV